jgi:subtilisin family serine protease
MAGKRDGRSRDAHAAIQSHRIARLAHRDDIYLDDTARSHLCVPSEVLVARDDLRLVEAGLGEVGATELEVVPPLTERVARFQIPDHEHVSDVVAQLRSRGRDSAARVGPNHVVTGLPNVQGGPASFAIASTEQIHFADGAGAGARVAVLDTGFAPKIHEWLDEHTDAGPGTLEDLDLHPRNGWLDDESGHGTFIAGLILARVPSATIEVAKVLDSEGYGTELDVARALIAHGDADVINLSLGCYSHDDLPPVALTEALRHVAPTSAVVAAAGNDSTQRPLWPAAHQRVLAVAAVDDSLERAAFSNFGWWVDAAARGVQVLSTFVEFDEVGHVKPIGGREPQDFRGWARWSGTSFAAPKLSAEIVARMTQDRGMSAREAAAAILASSTRPHSSELGIILDL